MRQDTLDDHDDFDHVTAVSVGAVDYDCNYGAVCADYDYAGCVDYYAGCVEFDYDYDHYYYAGCVEFDDDYDHYYYAGCVDNDDDYAATADDNARDPARAGCHAGQSDC